MLCALLLLPAAGLEAERRGAVRKSKAHEGGPRLVFSHEKHVSALEISCVDCHLQSTGHRVPAEEVCAGCHDQTRGGPDPACTMCHVGADLETLGPGDSLRRGEGMSAAMWACAQERYDHALHAGETHCGTCHPRATSSRRSEDSLYPRRRQLCAVCHASEPCASLSGAEPKLAQRGRAGGPAPRAGETRESPAP